VVGTSVGLFVLANTGKLFGFMVVEAIVGFMVMGAIVGFTDDRLGMDVFFIVGKILGLTLG
jgi:hypothetical protein